MNEPSATGTGVVAALEHLGQRVPHLTVVESRNRHWTIADLEAVETLLDRPASREQIALARIEGISMNGGYTPENLKLIHRIARRALGLPVST